MLFLTKNLHAFLRSATDFKIIACFDVLANVVLHFEIKKILPCFENCAYADYNRYSLNYVVICLDGVGCNVRGYRDPP